jgi:hypothetical protein
MSAFSNQGPAKQVAAFVSECLDHRLFDAPDLDNPYVHAPGRHCRRWVWTFIVLILFSSDYDDTFVEESGL